MPFLGFEPSWPSPLARCGWVTTCLRHSCAPPLVRWCIAVWFALYAFASLGYLGVA